MHVHDQIILFIQTSGPTTPTKVSKTIKESSLIASAHLSDLASQKKIKISKLKLGGSPLYFLPGQEDQLYNFAQGNMNPKDFIVLNKLKDKKVLRENEQELLTKVALRHLQDFAIPLQVRLQDRAELFWKWHLLPTTDANNLISQILNPKKQEEVEVSKKLEKELEEKLQADSVEQLKLKEAQEEKLAKESQEIQKPQEPKEEIKAVLIKETQVQEKQEIKPDPIKQLKELVKETQETKINEPVKEIKPEPKEPIKQETKEPLEPKEQIKQEPKESQSKLEPLSKENEIKKPKKVKTSKSAKDPFLNQIEEYFKDLEIQILDYEIVRKNKEIDMTLKVPSVIGKIKFFAKAKSKKKCDEKDLSSAYMQAQIKKLPLLFLYSKDINTKAKEMLNSDAFENAIIRGIEDND
jgi:hypothetical protein